MTEPIHIYLGDAVYGRYDPDYGQLSITLETHHNDERRIVMEPEVFHALIAFARASCGPRYDPGRTEL